MIDWIKYDPTSKAIESHVNHIVTNGHRVLIAQHAAVPGQGRYSWMINNSLIGWVTHWAKINLPARRCAVCNGSGRYDAEGSPSCAACDGTGEESQ